MSTRIQSAIIRCGIILSLFAAATAGAQTNQAVRIVRPAPPFSLPDLNDRPVRLSDFDGKAVIVFFFASWDKPCQRQLPVLIKLQAQFNPKMAQVIGIVLDNSTSKELAVFAEKQQVNFPILRFNLKIIQDFGGLQYIPTIFVLDKNHNVLQRYVGFTDQKPLEDDLNIILKQ